MVLPTPPPITNPIPNLPFNYSEENLFYSAAGPLIMGSGISIDYTTSVFNVSGGIETLQADLPLYLAGTPADPVIKINAATTASSGAVQLVDSVSSLSTTTAATPNSVKVAYDVASTASTQATSALALATAALPKTGGTMTGDIVFAPTQTIPASALPVASTLQTGIVQLFDGTNSTSDSLALTANQGKLLQDQINALGVTSNITLAGTIDTSTGFVDSVTPEGAGAGFVIGSAPPAPSVTNEGFFLIVDVEGSLGPAGTPPYHIGDWFLSSGTVWEFLNVGYQPPLASLTIPGIVQLEDSVTSTSISTAATPNSVKTVYDLAVGAIPDSTFTTLGELLVGTGPSTYAILPPGPDGQILFTDSSQPSGLKWNLPSASGLLTAISGIAPITINLTNPQHPVISIDSATTGSEGAVQLNDTVTSTSVSQAATANAVKIAYDAAAASVQSVTGVGPIAVDNLDPQNPVVSVDAASTLASGVVQLYDGVDSTSTTLAATANSVRIASEEAIPKSTLVAKGSLVTASAAGIPVNLSAGADGLFLKTDSAAPGGLVWSSAGVVSQVNTGTGLTGGPITSTGTVALADTAVTPGSYTYSSFTVDAQGRLTAASSGTPPVTSVSVSAPLSSTGGLTPTLSLDPTTVTPGSYVHTNLTVDSFGRITAASNGTVCLGTVTQVNTGTGITGGPITTTGTVALSNTSVTPGSYTNASFTVDQQGRLTAASSNFAPIPCSLLTAKGSIIVALSPSIPAELALGVDGQVLTVDTTTPEGVKWDTPTTGTVTSVGTGTGLTGGPVTTTGTIALADTAVTPGSYTYSALTVDQQGRLTAASSGITPVTCLDFNNKGDILVADNINSPTALPVGVDGQVLTACSLCSTGVVWATPSGGGGGAPLAYGEFILDCAATANFANGDLIPFTGTRNTVFNLQLLAPNQVLIQCAGVYNLSMSSPRYQNNTASAANMNCLRVQETGTSGTFDCAQVYLTPGCAVTCTHDYVWNLPSFSPYIYFPAGCCVQLAMYGTFPGFYRNILFECAFSLNITYSRPS